MSIRGAEFIPPILVPNGCPNCGGPCYLHTTESIGLKQVKCGRGLAAACGYHGPFSSDNEGAIRLHNAICRQPTPEAAEQPRTAEQIAGTQAWLDGLAHPPKPTTEAPPAYMFSVRRVSPAGQPFMDTFAAIDYHCEEGEELKRKEPLFAHPPKPEPTEAVGPKRHRWSPDGETCLDCRDKDWMAGPVCKAAKPPTKWMEAAANRTGHCAIHNVYYSASPTATYPGGCLFCNISNELRAQPAPRTYEVARALSLIDAVEAADAPNPRVELAEAAAKEIFKSPAARGYFERTGVGIDAAEKLATSIIAKHFQHAPKVPEGWQMVPVEPTRDMRDSGGREFLEARDRTSTTEWDDAAIIYKAMIAAVPKGEA